MNENSLIKKSKNNEEQHSTLSIISLAIGGMGITMLEGTKMVLMVNYYGEIIGLPLFLYFIAMVFYTIWDSFNDPLAGYLSDKSTRFIKKYGKRFPWILGSMVPYTLFSLLLWSPPYQLQGTAYYEIIIFFWFLFSLSLSDAMLSVWLINRNALIPTKYRTPESRTKFSAYLNVATLFGFGFGNVIIPIIVRINNVPSNYISVMFIINIISLICLLLSIPGSRESKQEIERVLFEEENTEKIPFFKIMKESLKVKNFRVIVGYSILIFLFNRMFASAIPYLLDDVLVGTDLQEILFMASYAFFNMISIPIIVKLRKKYGHLAIYRFALFAFPISLIIMFFTSSLNFWILMMCFNGFLVGILNSMYTPISGDLWDEMAVISKKRLEGTYNGILTFCNRWSQILQAFFFWITLDFITDFNSNEGPISVGAIWGIKTLGMLIPAISILITGFLFWKVWDLEPKKVEGIREELKDLGI